MRWDFGSVYKKIRQSKHLSQAEICQGVVSRANLSRIEANQVTPSLETMEFLLKQLNMDFEEFRYICHQYQYSAREAILLFHKNNLSVSSTQEFEELKRQCQDYLKTNPHDIPIKNMLRNLEVSISVRESGNSQQSQGLAARLWRELERYDTWYMADLRTLSYILF